MRICCRFAEDFVADRQGFEGIGRLNQSLVHTQTDSTNTERRATAILHTERTSTHLRSYAQRQVWYNIAIRPSLHQVFANSTMGLATARSAMLSRVVLRPKGLLVGWSLRTDADNAFYCSRAWITDIKDLRPRGKYLCVNTLYK